MSLTYPITLNQVFIHPLAFPENGICEIENNSQYYLYIAVGQWSRVADVQSNNVAVIPPYQKRAFKANIHNQTPSITLAPTNTPFAFTGTIANTPNVARVNEYADPKAYFPSQGFEGLAADYIIIAGGRIQANQFGLFEIDAGTIPAFAVIGQPTTWDGQAVNLGDVIVGPYFSQNRGLYWDAVNRALNVKGNITVLGGSGLTIMGVKGTFTATDSKTVAWTGVTIYLTDGSGHTIPDGNLTHATNFYILAQIDPFNSTLVVGTNPGTYPYASVAFVAISGNPAELASVFVNNGATVITPQSIDVQTLSALSANLGQITAGTVTGATIQTAASGPRLVINATNLSHFLDTTARAFEKWTDLTGANLAAQILASYDPTIGGGNTSWLTYLSQNVAGGQGQAIFGVNDSVDAKASFLSFVHKLGNTNSEIALYLASFRMMSWLMDAANHFQISYGYGAGGTTSDHAFAGGITTTGDVIALGQTQGGLYDRLVTRGVTPLQHFESSIGSLTWAGAPFSQAAINFYPSVAEIVPLNQRSFAFQTVSYLLNTQHAVMARLALAGGIDQAGVRCDDGSDFTYMELYLKYPGTVTNYCDLKCNSRVGGGAITTQTLLSTINLSEYIDIYLRLASDNNVYAYYRFQGYGWVFIGTILIGRALTMVRVGVLACQTSPGQGAADFDWYTTA